MEEDSHTKDAEVTTGFCWDEFGNQESMKIGDYILPLPGLLASRFLPQCPFVTVV
jgi:hypothetical protein